MRVEYVWILVVALCWGGYPLLSRWSGYGGSRGALILMLSGLLPIIVGSVAGHGGEWPLWGALAKLIVAGLMMGVGLVAFVMLTTSAMDASISIPIVDVAMLLVSTLGAIVFFAEAVTLQKVLGIVLLLAGIFLLRPT